MKNLLDFWIEPRQLDTPEINVNIRGSNDFGLDIIDITKDNEHIFRITAEGKVYIKDQEIGT
jgi:hypothetical protein